MLAKYSEKLRKFCEHAKSMIPNKLSDKNKNIMQEPYKRNWVVGCRASVRAFYVNALINLKLMKSNLMLC